MTRASLAIAILLSLSTTAQAIDPPQTSAFSLTLTERSPASDPVKITQRAGWTLSTIKKEIDITYDLSTESFEAYVPADYKADAPYGLIVWVSAGPKGDMPE